MRILVCGSRIWTDRDKIREVLSRFDAEAGVVLMHGGAYGADSIAGDIGAELGFIVEVYPALWNVHGKAAGPIRNIQMLEVGPDLVIAFWDWRSRGTQHTITQAERRGIKVEIHGC
jgi:hypothetical protein